MTAETPIYIAVDNTTFRGVLHDNAATRSLRELLPLDLYFEDFGGQEKLARLPAPLSLDGMPSGSGAEPGTIGYYAPDQVLVLYYASVGHYPGIIPLGVFDDAAAIRELGTFRASMNVHR